MTRAEKLPVSAPAQGPAAPLQRAPAAFGPAAVLALQRTAGNVAVTAWLSRAPAAQEAFDPQPLVSTLRQAIDQVRVRDKWSVDADEGLHASTRHVDLDAVARALDGLTPEQVTLVKIRYQAEAVTTLENDLLGMGRSATAANLSADQADRVRALLTGTGARHGEAPPESHLEALAAELHELAVGELADPQRERLMALYREYGTGIEPAYVKRYGHAPAVDLRGKLAARQLERLDALRAGDHAHADAYAIDDKRAAMDALDRRRAGGETSVPKEFFEHKRAELADDAAGLANASVHEMLAAHPELPAAQAAQAALAATGGSTPVVAALSGGRLIEATARRLLELEARHTTDTEHVLALLHELHGFAAHDVLAGTQTKDKARLDALVEATAKRYAGLFGVMYDGLRPAGGRSWAAILASAKQADMLEATASGGGQLDAVDELHFAVERRDAAAVRHVLDQHAGFEQMVELNARYLGRYHLDLRHAVFGATGIEVALHPDSALVPSASAVRGRDAAAVLEALDSPRGGGEAEVKWIVDSAQREIRAVKAASGLAGAVLDAETAQMMTVTLATIRMLADRWHKDHSDETLAELRGARARLRVDATGYEGDLEHLRGQVRSVVTVAVQAALTLIPGIGEGLTGFLATSVLNSGANVIANALIQGDAYDLDMLYNDVVGGLAGALGGKLGEETAGLVAGGRKVSREVLDVAAKQITGESAERAIAMAKAAGRTTKLAAQSARAAKWAQAGRAARKAVGQGANLTFATTATSLATGQNGFTFEGLTQGVVLSAVGHSFAHPEPKVVTDESMGPGDAKVHYNAERPGVVEDVHVRVPPGADARMVAEHQAVAQGLKRFEGLSGVLNRLYEQAHAFVTGEPAALPGTRVYDVRTELQKLRGRVAGHLQELAAGTGDQAALATEVKHLAAQIDYYAEELAEIEADPAAGLEPGRGWIAVLSPESFAALPKRQGIRKRFAAADAGHDPRTGAPPSERLNAAIRVLEQAGLGEPGRALIQQLFEVNRRSKILSKKNFTNAVEEVERAAAIVSQNEEMVRLKGLTTLHGSILNVAREVFAAYQRGETIRGEPIENRQDPKLAAAMEAMHQAFADFNANQSESADPVERLMKLLQLQTRVGETLQELRAHVATFTPHVELVGDPTPSDLVAGLQQQTIRVSASGDVSEPWARQKFERELHSAGELAQKREIPAKLRRAFARLLSKYELAHLIGPGIGGELREGIMLAPQDMNQKAQNKGVELLIRTAAELGFELTLDVVATGRRLMVPLGDGSVLPVDILTRVEYRIMGLEDGLEITIDVTDPPDGRAVVTGEVPADVPGAKELLRRLTRPRQGGPAPTGAPGPAGRRSPPRGR